MVTTNITATISATLSLLALSSLFMPAFAQVSSEDLSLMKNSCRRTIDIPRIFSSDGRIRAEYITYCEPKNTRQPVIFFEATAMEDFSYRGANQSPYMHVQFYDPSNNLLADFSNVIIVDVPNCGGYEFHSRRVPTGAWSSNIGDIRVSMGGTNGHDCKPSPWRSPIAAAAAVIRAARDCRNPAAGLNPKEQEICEFLKNNGAVRAQ